jgi:hypothetical protein
MRNKLGGQEYRKEMLSVLASTKTFKWSFPALYPAPGYNM